MKKNYIIHLVENSADIIIKLSYSVYVIIYHGFEFVKFQQNFSKLWIILTSPERTKHVYNVKLRNIISKLAYHCE